MENEKNGARVRIKFADRLKVNVPMWNKLTNDSARYADWSEVARKVNEHIGTSEGYDGHMHSWSNFINDRRRILTEVGFDRNGTLNIAIYSRAKDSTTKFYSTDEVVAILNEVSKCINAFADAGIL